MGHHVGMRRHHDLSRGGVELLSWHRGRSGISRLKERSVRADVWEMQIWHPSKKVLLNVPTVH